MRYEHNVRVLLSVTVYEKASDRSVNELRLSEINLSLLDSDEHRDFLTVIITLMVCCGFTLVRT